MLDFSWYPAALMALRPLLEYDEPQVHKAIMKALVRIRRHMPEQVEDWLSQHEAPGGVTAAVFAYHRSGGTEEPDDVSAYLDLFRLVPFGHAAPHAVHIRTALELPDLRTWGSRTR